MPEKSLTLLRYAIVLLFLWFGWHQLIDPGAWVTYLPQWTGYFPVPGEMLVQLNGWMELVLAVLLAFGWFVRPVAAFLALHLFGIAVTVMGAIGMRDFVLGLATVVLAMNPPDAWALEIRDKT